MIMYARAAGRGTVRGAVKSYVTLLAVSWWPGLTCVFVAAFTLGGGGMSCCFLLLGGKKSDHMFEACPCLP